MNFDRNIAHLIDHTILKPEATRNEVMQICAEARQYEFASVCVNSCWVPLVAEELKGAPSKVCSVVGFPLGAASTAAKAAETRDAVSRGAREIDMVLNVGALRGGEPAAVEDDIRAVVSAAGPHALVKVILETCLLTDEQKVLACQISKRAGAAFVKTSTGFGKAGATVEDIVLMRQTVGPEMGVKASGGVRTVEDVLAMVAAGATRIGSSSGVKIVQASSSAAPADAGAPGGPGIY